MFLFVGRDNKLLGHNNISLIYLWNLFCDLKKKRKFSPHSLKFHVATYFRFVATMTHHDNRKFCRDTCHLDPITVSRLQSRSRQEFSCRNRDWFYKLKNGRDKNLKVVSTLFLLPFTLVSKNFVAIRKTGSRQHISMSSIATELFNVAT